MMNMFLFLRVPGQIQKSLVTPITSCHFVPRGERKKKDFFVPRDEKKILTIFHLIVLNFLPCN